MGRTLKRVALDFDWPMNKVWYGYQNPYHSTPCPDCEIGYSPEAEKLRDQWYGGANFDPVAYGSAWMTPDHEIIRSAAERQVQRDPQYYTSVKQETYRLWELWHDQWCHNLCQEDVDALLKAGRLMDFTHVPRNEEQRKIVEEKLKNGGNSWLPEPSGYHPTAQEVNEWSLKSLGHDSINAAICLNARCEREGIQVECSRCEGHGEIWPDPKVKKLHDEWTESEPPEGSGFQLWETTSEGSPVSPVFETLEQLCEWCAHKATTFGDHTATTEEWKSMLEKNSVSHKEGNIIFL